jgi:pyridoxamine 5'-phosphate oxidase
VAESDPTRRPFDESDLAPDPLVLFRRWFEDAKAAKDPSLDALALATATPDGRPSLRYVLLKGADERGLVFYSNYESRKGRELAANPRAALLLYWVTLHRQVRAEGAVTHTSAEESARYFASRPLDSRLSAAVSRQSEVVPSRQVLEERRHALAQAHEATELVCPPHWGGFRVVPDTWEFWQSRPNRLHDRFRYTRQPGGTWLIERLSP